jgi:pantoate--beta-alanine ligase
MVLSTGAYNKGCYFKQTMIIFKRSKDLLSYLDKIKLSKRTVGFVPTMGALHEGHLSLIEASKNQSNVTVCSIFVNPTQFNNLKDFEKYPVTIEKDIALLEENECDILFLPDEKEIYPDAASKEKHFNLGNLEKILEGKFRPGHFQGVCLIMDKLLDIVSPDLLFIGQKDFQQCLVIKKLIEEKRMSVRVIICRILREENGLAMSSRNTRLSSDEKKIAAKLFQSLQSIKQNLSGSNFTSLKQKAISDLEQSGFKVDYLELANKKDLSFTGSENKEETLILLIAAYLNDVRLIDNLIINE